MTFVTILAEIILAAPAAFAAFLLNFKLYKLMSRLIHAKLLVIVFLSALAVEVSFFVSTSSLAFWPRFSLDTLVYVGLVSYGTNKLYRISKVLLKEIN